MDSSPVGAIEVGEHEDVEQLGAGSRTQGVEALTELALEFLGGMRVSAFAACSATA